MAKRVLTTLAILTLGLPGLIVGGWPYFAVIAFFLLTAVHEYAQMFCAAGYEPPRLFLLGGVLLLMFLRQTQSDLTLPGLALLTLALMAWHVSRYEAGRSAAAADFTVSAAGLLYLGWLGSYLLDLRALPDGAWWTFLVMPSVWLGDVGAYAIGAAYGRHKMTPRLSPKKSWEGFWAGVFTAALTGGFLAFCYSTWGPLRINLWQGALLGLALGLLTPLGDFGESMFKRQSGMKDSGSAIPGHGGAFDRIDSWLWGAPLGYFFILWFIF